MRHLRRCLAASIILAAAVPRSTFAQTRQPAVAAIGDTVRVLAATAPRLPAAQQPLTGVLAHVRPEAIVVRTRGDSAIVARPVAIQVQRGTRAHRGAVAAGIILGAPVGAVLGAFLGAALECGGSCRYNDDPYAGFGGAIAGIGAGALVGAGLGGTAASRWRSPRWIAAMLPTQTP